MPSFLLGPGCQRRGFCAGRWCYVAALVQLEERGLQLKGERVLVDLREVQVEVRDREEAAAGVEAEELAAGSELQSLAVDYLVDRQEGHQRL